VDIGLVKEARAVESRVALTPTAVHALCEAGHRVYVESNAGADAGFDDEEYRLAGGHIAYHREEAIQRGEVVCMVLAPEPQDYELLEEGQILYAFLLLAVQPRKAIDTLVEKKITAIGMEMIVDDSGRAPIQQAMSEIGGPLAVHMAARFLQTPKGGRGILLGGIPGVAPAHVVILGGGSVGWAATRAALGLGAQVTLLDSNAEVLRRLHDQFGGRAVTRMSHTRILQKMIPTADVLIAAASVHGLRAPALVGRDMVRQMKNGAVILDVAIDAGGCVETSRPTTIEHPTYIEEGVIHCCVPNLPSLVARTSSYVLANASLPYLQRLGSLGADKAALDPGLASGYYIDKGEIVKPNIAVRLEQSSADAGTDGSA
jgi:alanine dehydrogenase